MWIQISQHRHEWWTSSIDQQLCLKNLHTVPKYSFIRYCTINSFCRENGIIAGSNIAFDVLRTQASIIVFCDAIKLFKIGRLTYNLGPIKIKYLKVKPNHLKVFLFLQSSKSPKIKTQNHVW